MYQIFSKQISLKYLFSILANFQHFKFTAHGDMQNLTDRRTDTQINYGNRMLSAPKHNEHYNIMVKRIVRVKNRKKIQYTDWCCLN